ncbi:WG repeat-containing protein [Psychrobacter sp. TB55-MNA-CIBAN-0194]|uniref:WG repeat-containing protein n=1 Tax=Psychrobacter sp. TB55-MNA-CIBAN-0194 TaxID=3140445 RepID=UPI003332E2F8
MLGMKGIKLLMLLALSYSHFSYASMEVEYCKYPPFESNQYTIKLCMQDSMSVVERVPYWGAVDLNGVEVIPTQYDLIDSFSEGLAIVYDFGTGKKAYINKKGEFITDYIFDNATDFSEGLGAVYKGNQQVLFDPGSGVSGFINAQGKLQIPMVYQFAFSFKEGFAPVIRDGK